MFIFQTFLGKGRLGTWLRNLGRATLSPQEVEWAFKNRRGAPKDSKCAQCYAVAKAWPFTTWDALVLKKGSDEQFAKQWSLAVSLMSSKVKEPPFLQCSVASSEMGGYRVARSMLFLTEAEVETLTGSKPVALGLQVEKIIGS